MSERKAFYILVSKTIWPCLSSAHNSLLNCCCDLRVDRFEPWIVVIENVTMKSASEKVFE